MTPDDVKTIGKLLLRIPLLLQLPENSVQYPVTGVLLIISAIPGLIGSGLISACTSNTAALAKLANPQSADPSTRRLINLFI
jgi:hypothetical protein